MDQDAIIRYISTTFEGLNVVTATDGLPAGDTFFIYDPRHELEPKQQIPFATIVTKDYGEFDNASNLDRPGVFRLNVGLSRESFKALFPNSDASHDYTALDMLMPHPVYAAQSWVSVLNPGEATFEQLKPLLEEAYLRATRRQFNR